MSPFWFHLDPEHALEGPRMAIRVPGEFHEASSRGHLCHRASRSPSYARPRHFPTRDEFISATATSPATQPASQPLLARPPPANQPAAPHPTTTGHGHPDHGHSRPSQSQPNPTRANQPPAPARKPTASLHALPRYSALRDTPCRAWEMLMRKSPIFSRASRMFR